MNGVGGQFVWCVQVRSRAQGDARRKLWVKSKPMTYTMARKVILEYERTGHECRIVNLLDEVAEAQ